MDCCGSDGVADVGVGVAAVVGEARELERLLGSGAMRRVDRDA